MTDTAVPRTLHWRMRRGMKELDLVLNRWVQQHWQAADDRTRACFEALLDREDPDLWSWLMGYAEAPAGDTRELIEQLRHYC